VNSREASSIPVPKLKSLGIPLPGQGFAGLGPTNLARALQYPARYTRGAEAGVKRIGMGIVGAGFVGPHHVDAVRRLGYVDVVAVAGSSDASARAKADALGARKAYGSYEALLDDPDVHVVHNATPNYLHYPVNAAAIAKGKHVVSDKPLAMTAAAFTG
jgi:predicted homoserine dehydrogenase-like protein